MSAKQKVNIRKAVDSITDAIRNGDIHQAKVGMEKIETDPQAICDSSFWIAKAVLRLVDLYEIDIVKGCLDEAENISQNTGKNIGTEPVDYFTALARSSLSNLGQKESKQLFGLFKKSAEKKQQQREELLRAVLAK